MTRTSVMLEELLTVWLTDQGKADQWMLDNVTVETYTKVKQVLSNLDTGPTLTIQQLKNQFIRQLDNVI